MVFAEIAHFSKHCDFYHKLLHLEHQDLFNSFEMENKSMRLGISDSSLVMIQIMLLIN